MARTIKADGDTWEVRLGERPPGRDLQTVLFFCRTTDQRPYRVVQVSREEVPGEERLEALSDEQIRGLFLRSRSLDFPRAYPTYGG